MKNLLDIARKLSPLLCLVATAISVGAAEVGNIIVRFHPDSGTELIESSPAIGSDGTIYFTTRDSATDLGAIYAVNPVSGQKIKSIPMNKIEAHGIMSSPAIGPNGRVFVGNGKQVTAYSPQLGVKVWDSDVFQPGGGVGVDQANFMCTPTLGPENPPKIYVANDDATYCDAGIFALDYNSGARSGGHIFNFDLNLFPANQIFADVDSSLAISSGGIVYMIAEHQNYVAAADSAKNFDCSQPPSPVWLANVHTEMDNVDVGLPDGSTHQRFQFTHFNSSPAVGSDGTVYVGAREGVAAIGPVGDVALFSPRTSSEDLLQLRSFRSSPAIGADGTVYIGCDNGRVYAIQPAGFATANGYLKWTFTPDWTPAVLASIVRLSSLLPQLQPMAPFTSHAQQNRVLPTRPG
jgi:outer membrane protein assembly factor BamB